MSRYDWEEGTLKIPTKAWKPLRDSLVTTWNRLQANRLALALELHAAILQLKPTFKRGTFSVRTALGKLADSGIPGHKSLYARYVEDDSWAVERSLMARTETGGSDPSKLAKPKKQDFPLAVASKATSFDAGDGATITLDAKTHSLNWCVSENNHAVERAWASPMGRALRAALKGVEWTRGSGGEFVGNDEYNRDNRDADGGGNYVTATFGPPKKPRSALKGIAPSLRRYY